jgi:hypothetical protein
METMWKSGLATWAMTFSDDLAQAASFVRDYLHYPRRFRSPKQLCISFPRCVSTAGRQHENDRVVDLVKRIEVFPASE